MDHPDTDGDAAPVCRERVVGQRGDVPVTVAVPRDDGGSPNRAGGLVLELVLQLLLVVLPHRMLVLVLDHNRRRPPPQAPEPGDHERTAARHARAVPMAQGRHDDPHAERDQRHAHQPFHHVPDGLREVRRREDDGGPDRKRNRRMPERVHRGEHHRAAPALL
jgi:hypothetical protein